LTATVINFDDIVGAPDNAFEIAPVLPPGMYASQGIIISGFGTNGGAVFNLSGSTGDATAFLSPPNTAGVDCQRTSIVTSQGFDGDGNLLGTVTMTVPETGTTIAQTFPAPGDAYFFMAAGSTSLSTSTQP
jgi:hypothetical protein